jgi:hypothetical protein
MNFVNNFPQAQKARGHAALDDEYATRLGLDESAQSFAPARRLDSKTNTQMPTA